MGASNRRKHARVKPKALAARIRAGDQLHIGLGIDNISMGGAFVRCNTALPVGARVKLEIQKPGSPQMLTFTGVVTSSIGIAQANEQRRAAGVGVRFDPVPPHLEAWLKQIVAQSPVQSAAAQAEEPQEPPRLERVNATALRAALPPIARSAPPVAPPGRAPVAPPRGGLTAPPQSPSARLPAVPPMKARPPAALEDDQQDTGTQSELPAYLPSNPFLPTPKPDLDSSQLLDEVNGLKALVAERDRRIAELKAENQKLRLALERHLSRRE